MAVAGAIEPSITQAEIRRANRKPTENLQAYDWLLRALGEHQLYSRDGSDRAMDMARRAIELDPRYAQAYAYLASWIMRRKIMAGWRMKPRDGRRACASPIWRCSWRRTTRSC